LTSQDRRRNNAPTRRPWLRFGLLGIAAALATLGAGAAGAADAEGRFRIMGSGNLQCGQWLNDHRENNTSAAQSEMWIAGYLTAYNQFMHKEQDVTAPYDGNFVLDWIDGYCRQQPGNPLILAARSLLEELRRGQ